MRGGGVYEGCAGGGGCINGLRIIGYHRSRSDKSSAWGFFCIQGDVGVPKNWGHSFGGGPHNQGLGSILGPPNYGHPHVK